MTTETVKPTSPLAYLKAETQFSFDEWKALSTEDQQDLKRWAEEEMNVRGIPIKESAPKTA